MRCALGPTSIGAPSLLMEWNQSKFCAGPTVRSMELTPLVGSLIFYPRNRFLKNLKTNLMADSPEESLPPRNPGVPVFWLKHKLPIGLLKFRTRNNPLVIFPEARRWGFRKTPATTPEEPLPDWRGNFPIMPILFLASKKHSWMMYPELIKRLMG